MKAEIITIGDEILIGQTVDTNSAWLGEELSKIGVSVTRIISISDKRDDIIQALDESLARVNLVLMTGGLGPTQDDITKQTLAEYFKTKLETDQEIREKIIDAFSKRGYPILEANLKQADLPKSAEILLNKRGTAMGMWFERSGNVVISMPGVPYEMKGIMTEFGLEKIQRRFEPPVVIHETILTQGIGESFLAETLSDWETSLRNEGFSLAYLPSPGMVKLRISAQTSHAEKERIEARISEYAKEIYRRVPEHIFGTGKETLQDVLGKMLLDRKATISTAESCTGGYVAHLITSVPGSSAYFLGSVVAYAYDAKEQVLGVSREILEKEGAVSEAVVRIMAEEVRRKMGTTYSISISGIAGPDGGTPEKPVGTVWMALASSQKTLSRKFQFGKDRMRNISVTALSALNWLRNEILSGEFE